MRVQAIPRAYDERLPLTHGSDLRRSWRIQASTCDAEKLTGPALTAVRVGEVDAVLLSHDQHADNFDRAGKAYAMAVPRLFTTLASAQRLGRGTHGLAPWQSTTINKPDGTTLQVTATPARHGPAGIEPLSGDVIGFVVRFADGVSLYITGDTVWVRRHSRGGAPLSSKRGPPLRRLGAHTRSVQSHHEHQ